MLMVVILPKKMTLIKKRKMEAEEVGVFRYRKVVKRTRPSWRKSQFLRFGSDEKITSSDEQKQDITSFFCNSLQVRQEKEKIYNNI